VRTVVFPLMFSDHTFCASYVLHRRSVPSIPPWFAQPKNTTGKIQPVKLVARLLCRLVLRLPEVHLFTSALVFQTYRIHVLPQKARDKVSRPYKAPRITRFEVRSSCLLTCHLRHLTHLNA
jgi:hypothetical protein